MKASVALITAIVLIGLTISAAAEEVSVYRWIDEQGVPQFTDRPPSNAGAELTGIRSQRTDQGAVQARVEQRSSVDEEAAKRRNDSAADAQSAAQEREQTRAQRSDNCSQARERLETYSTARRLYRPMADGEREYLSSEEMDAAKASAEQEVADWCD
jgi:catalase